MPEEQQIAFQITYASVEAGTGADPTAEVERILGEQRVLAAVREFDGNALVVLLPITDAGAVVALAEDGRLRFDLTAARVKEMLAAADLTLHLDATHDSIEAIEAIDAELDEQFSEVFEQLDDAAASPDDLPGFGMPSDAALGEGLVSAEPVAVAEFSRRGLWAARLTAQIVGADVDHAEGGAWSMLRYRTPGLHIAVSGGAADLPIIEVNVPALGEAWVEVTAPHGRTAMFWPNAERLTRPVLDIDTIELPESADVYRQILTDADGTRDELVALALGRELDVDAAHRACMPEASGGTTGERERLVAFVAAFGVPTPLVAAGLDESEPGRRFRPRGWPRTIGDLLLGGIVEATALTRRDRLIARAARFLRRRPLLAVSLSAAELAAGVAAARARSPLSRGIGILLVIDAVADLAILAVRSRRH